MAKDLDSSVDDDRLARMAEKLNTKPVIDNGAAELFAPKLSKEEKKAEAARKKAERDARKAEEKGQVAEDGADTGGAPAAASPAMKRKGGKEKESKADKVTLATARHQPPPAATAHQIARQYSHRTSTAPLSHSCRVVDSRADQTELRLPPLALAKGGLPCPEHGLQRAQIHTRAHTHACARTHTQSDAMHAYAMPLPCICQACVTDYS